MFTVNLRLRAAFPCRRAVFSGLCALLACALALTNPARAESVPAVPVKPVAAAPLKEAAKAAPVLSRGPVIIELFSSQACAFCPRADRLLADLAEQVHVIALACHIDYFDVRAGALSHPFCSDRQNWYMRALRGGPNYTPQMVVQGRYDAIGYDIPAVTHALRRAANHIPPAVTIAYAGESGQYRVTLPALREDRNYRISLLVYDLPHNVIVGEGRNKGQKMNYVNIVSALEDLGAWNALDSDSMIVTINRKPEQRGFAILAQDEKTGEIAAAGRHLFGQQRNGEQDIEGPLRTAPAPE